MAPARIPIKASTIALSTKVAFRPVDINFSSSLATSINSILLDLASACELSEMAKSGRIGVSVESSERI